MLKDIATYDQTTLVQISKRRFIENRLRVKLLKYYLKRFTLVTPGTDKREKLLSLSEKDSNYLRTLMLVLHLFKKI